MNSLCKERLNDSMNHENRLDASMHVTNNVVIESVPNVDVPKPDQEMSADIDLVGQR